MLDPAALTNRKRQILAVFLLVTLFLAGAVPRVLLYGSAVVPSTLARLLLLLTEIGILRLVSENRRSTSFELRVGAALIVMACAGATFLDAQIEARLPGSIYPPVLYSKPPSFLLAFAWASTEGILRVALWFFVCVFPRELEQSRAKAVEAANLERAYALAQLRERLEPARVSATLIEMGDSLQRDPRRAREQLAAIGERLDTFMDVNFGGPAEPLPQDADREISVLTSTLRTPIARRQFVLAVSWIAGLFALNALARLAEYGWPVLRIELIAFVRITAELVLFWFFAERASRHGMSVIRTITYTFCATLTLNFVATSIMIGLEASFPRWLFPASIYTHPTPAIRLLVRAVTTSFVDVAFGTLVYLYPLASFEAAERAAVAMKLRRKADVLRLRGTLAPHFVRNALNVIAGLVTEDPDEARRLLNKLGELLVEFEHDDENHSVGREVKWLRAYATLLEARYPDRLSFSFEVDPRVENFLIPRLLLQPLVENAVIHGVLSRQEAGRVGVTITQGTTADTLVCIVEDDGPGMQREYREGGVGVRLVRERLAVHARGGRLMYQSTKCGVRAVLELPEELP